MTSQLYDEMSVKSSREKRYHDTVWRSIHVKNIHGNKQNNNLSQIPRENHSTTEIHKQQLS